MMDRNRGEPEEDMRMENRTMDDWKDNVDRLIGELRNEIMGFSMKWVWYDCRERVDQFSDDDDLRKWMSESEVGRTLECGTAACIYGTALKVLDNMSDANDFIDNEISQEDVRRKLNLDKVGFGDLVTPGHDNAYFGAECGEPGFITRNMAVACLENYRDTGKIDWDCDGVNAARQA